jgi:hypothetical protein
MMGVIVTVGESDGAAVSESFLLRADEIIE